MSGNKGNITFSDKDAIRVNSHDNDRYFPDILLWDAFQKLQLNPNNVKMFIGSLIGLSGKQVQVRGHVTLETTYGDGVDAKAIWVSYIIMGALSPYNIIWGRFYINVLRMIIST